MNSNAQSLSTFQARKLVLLSQRIPPPSQKGTAMASTLTAIEHLGYIQIDTISAIQRAHHHTLWNRNPRYQNSHLDELTAGKNIFEYWSHAAAYLPMRDYRFTLPRKQALIHGRENHWYVKDKQLMKYVLQRITSEGPLMARDFSHKAGEVGEWRSKPAKQALDTLFMQGELMISRRENFQKVYDLRERVIPVGLDVSMPGEEEHARHLITRYLQANGPGQTGEMVYLLKNKKKLISAAVEEMVLEGEILPMSIKNKLYYVLPATLELLDRPLIRNRAKILSPFDNLLIQRQRMRDLFDFNYLLECYVPEGKRKFGYFALPLLWDGKLVARMDCKADSKTSILHIHKLNLESGLRKTESFARDLAKELLSFLKFNKSTSLCINHCSPATFKPELEKALKNEEDYSP